MLRNSLITDDPLLEIEKCRADLRTLVTAYILESRIGPSENELVSLPAVSSSSPLFSELHPQLMWVCAHPNGISYTYGRRYDTDGFLF